MSIETFVEPSFSTAQTATLTAGTGPAVAKGNRVRLAWRFACKTGEVTVEIGGPGVNPAVGLLDGAKVGDKVRVTMHDARGLEGCVPPCFSGARVTLDVEVLERMG
jgi:hypothetical protein